MRIVYIANMRMPTERAHGIQVVKTCEALAQAGVEVELVVPRRKTSILESPFAYYGVEENFRITYVPVIDSVSWGRVGFFVETVSFALGARKYVRGSVYGRDELVLALLMLACVVQVVWETHTGAWNLAARFVSRRATHIVAISQGLKDFYSKRGVPQERIVVAHDGVDLDDFATPEPRGQARRRLGLPQDAALALYVGGLEGWKGAEVLCRSAKFLQGGIRVAVIGPHYEELQEKYPSVTFLGPRPYAELAHNLAAADVLVLPNSARS